MCLTPFFFLVYIHPEPTNYIMKDIEHFDKVCVFVKKKFFCAIFINTIYSKYFEK